jgi:hypothetical protein
MRNRFVLVAASFALSSGVVAEELAKSGPIEGRFYSHNVQTIAELDTADGMKSYVVEGYEFHVGKQPDDLFDGTSSRCLGYGWYSPDGSAAKEIGRCTLVDADGDQIFEEYEVELTVPNDDNPSKATILGGTGKYKSISGSLTAKAEVLPPLGKSDTMWAGDYKGEYTISD